MASYNISVDYDITCDECEKYFNEEDVWDLEEYDRYLEWESGILCTYYRCNNCETGTVTTYC